MNDSGIIYKMLLLSVPTIQWVIDQFCRRFYSAISLQDCRSQAWDPRFQKLACDTHLASQVPPSLTTKLG